MLKRTALMGLKAVSIALLLASTGQALAASEWVSGQVERVLVRGDGTYGGCMALLNVVPSDLTCSSGWVTFSCTGDFAEPVLAYRMLDSAQLALATGKNVFVGVRDDMMHNGYCHAFRIDVMN